MKKRLVNILVLCLITLPVFSQKNPKGLIDKTIAVVGNEMISLSQLEQELQYMRANGMLSIADSKADILEKDIEAKLFLMQARIDSLNVNSDYVNSMLKARIDELRQALGGEREVEQYFGKPMYKLKREWRSTLENQSLTQQMQQKIASATPDLTPRDVKEFLAALDTADIPIVPTKYQISQICIYPNKENANLAVKERLLSLRERIINGEKFSTLARIYSEDKGTAVRGGELGMTPKSSFWPVFSDAAMSLKDGMISQIVESPDGFHLIQLIEKKGDMFNARHILLKPKYTVEDMDKGFKRLDSLRNLILDNKLTFEQAALYYSQDLQSRTNGGKVADAQTGAAFIAVDKISPAQEYNAIKDLKEGEISMPFESLDREGRNGNTVYKIIKVDKIIPAHRANLEHDYNLLLELAKDKAAKAAINKFIEDKLSSTNIFIDPMFKGAKFSRESLNKLVKKIND